MAKKRKRPSPPPPPDPDRFDEAIRDFKRRVPLTDPEFRDLSAAEKRRSFWVAGVTQARMVQEVKDAIDRAIRDGTTLEDFKAEVGDKLSEAWGSEYSPRLETVFRTNVLSSYNGGRHQIFSDPVVQEARPYLRFDAVGDARTSEICEQLDGTVLPADDPFWHTHTPPLHHQCRSILTPLTLEEAGDEGIARTRPDTKPDDGFGSPPDPENDTPDLSGFDPDIRDVLKRRQ